MARTTALAAGLVALALAGSAQADWPSARHDARRTAATNGTCDITQPSPYWKYFHGGAIGTTQALALDVDGDGKAEAILASGDGIAAKHPDDGDTVWHNADVSFGEIDGLADLDGDKTAELVVHSNSRAFVLRVKDGTTLWAEPPSEMGTLSALRIGDLSGDGIPDLMTYECSCCSVNSGKSPFVYSFAQGYGAPKLLWQPLPSLCGGGHSAALVHMRTPNLTDFIYGAADHLELHDGKSSVKLAEQPPFGSIVQASNCQPVDVDGDKIDELLCVLFDVTTPSNGRRAYLLRYLSGPPQLTVAWETLVGTDGGNVLIPASAIADLDGDGKLEVTLGGKNAAGNWAVFVIDAQTGAVRAQVDGVRVSGTAPILGGGKAAVLGQKGADLFAYRFTPGQGTGLTAAWTLAGRGMVGQADFAAGQRGQIATRTLTFDVDGDGVGELVTIAEGKLVLVRATGGAPVDVASYSAPPDVGIATAWSFPIGKGGAPALCVAQSDGNFHVLNGSFAPVSGRPDFGAHFGGFYSSSQFRQLGQTPIVAELGDGIPGLMLVNSRGALQRLDARAATFAEPPKVLWSRERTSSANVVPDLLGATRPGIVAVEHAPDAADAVVALAPDGTVAWKRGVTGIVLTDIAHGNFNGDGTPDLIVEHGDLGNSLLLITALSGKTGAPLWGPLTFGPANRQPAGGAVADWNGDGIDDYVFVFTGTLVLDGKTGKTLLTSQLATGYYMPMLRDVTGDGIDEATLYAGLTAPGTLTHDLGTYLWKGMDGDLPLTYGAISDCPGKGQMLLGGSWSTPPRLSRIIPGGPGAGTTKNQVLAGGTAFPDVASAQKAGVYLGQLGSPSIHQNLSGDNVPVAVLGSQDGWLYGVDACGGQLRFARHLGAPVGSIGFGDANGDGKDEIIASVADGYLYALRQSPVPPVALVNDIDPPHGITDRDVDEIDTQDTLYAAWPAVTGAESYEVAVVHHPSDGGGFLSAGPWIGVGNATLASVSGLPLVKGKRYLFAVRALKGGERSPDTLSDGVRVVAPKAPNGNVLLTGRSCVFFCGVAPAGDRHAAWWLVALGVALGLRRRSRAARG